MSSKDNHYNRYGEKDVRPGHFQHSGGIGSLYRGHDEAPYISMPTFEDEFGMTREEEVVDIDWSHDPRSESFSEKHYGKGPRNWPSEESILQMVSERLFFSQEVDARDIEIRFKDGTIILKGTVPDRRQKKAAERWIENIPGVEDIQNLLELRK